MAYNFWICPLCYRHLNENPIDPDGSFHCPDCGTLEPADIDLARFEREHAEVEDYETGTVYLVSK